MINAMYRIAGNMLSPQGERGCLSILIYHRVLRQTDALFPYEVTAEIFDAQMQALKSTFNVIPLAEAVDRLKVNALPARAACVTFDDGYADNATIALPILRHHGIAATFFIATAYLNGGRMFNDTVIHAIRNSREQAIDLSRYGLGEMALETLESKRNAISNILHYAKYNLPFEERQQTIEELAQQITDVPPPDDLMMNTSQLMDLLNAGMDIGGHTAQHPILAKVNLDTARREIAKGKEYLESALDMKLRFFAYPNGKFGSDYLSEHVDLVKQSGFEAAVSTDWGASDCKANIFQLARFTPYSVDIKRFAPMLLMNIWQASHRPAVK